MTPDELDDALAAMRWTGATLATELGVSQTLVSRWRGRLDPVTPVPDAVSAFLRARIAALAQAPPPEAVHQPAPNPIEWRDRRGPHQPKR